MPLYGGQRKSALPSPSSSLPKCYVIFKNLKEMTTQTSIQYSLDYTMSRSVDE